jgi:diaminopimelate epimerase
MRFTKMHGLGNDYVYVNGFAETVGDPARLARAVSDRHRGIGSDGLILICPSSKADVRMEMYNADGSRGQMCGNGIRCVAKYAYEHGLATTNPMRVETDAGVLTLELTLDGPRVALVRVNLGKPRLRPEDLPVRLAANQMLDHPVEINGRTLSLTCVSMGNPHAVVFVDSLDSIDLARDGAALENHPLFPERCNIHFAKVSGPADVEAIHWERGSGATLACGTGACAVCVAGALTKRTQRHITARLPGGELALEWSEKDDCVYMTGSAEEVFSGTWPAG